MKRYVLALFLLLSFSAYSQNTINNYKYVVVPEKFSFLKQNDQYSLNSLTKAFLEDKGFTTYFDNNELPTELANNKCQALSADVLEKSGMFTTSLTLLLKDCQGNIIFKSKEGKSREKEYGVAYKIALRDAFSSLDKVSYVAKTTSTNEPAQSINTTTASETPAKPTAVAANQQIQPIVTTTVSETSVKLPETAINQPTGTLYAQAIASGYQLIDTTPKIVLTLLKTSAENYFIASSATANGIVLKKDGDWFFEYYKDGKLISEKLLVKF
ncbi:MAG TPA: hypothetical protein VL442_04460 [Mucilaginibacter sp.]|jgi:hypothetical protein|nr:hypothetical protein [Mucilaginibacter sp.]